MTKEQLATAREAAIALQNKREDVLDIGSHLKNIAEYMADVPSSLIIELLDHVESLEAKLEKAKEALNFYSLSSSWCEFKKDNMHRADILVAPEDRESFGEYQDDGSSLLCISGGKIAREVLKELES